MALNLVPDEQQHANQVMEKALAVVMQLSSLGVIKSLGPIAPKPGQEFAFALYNLALLGIYGLDIFLVICLITSFDGLQRPWLTAVRRAFRPLMFVTLAMSFATGMLGSFLTLLP